MSDEVLMGWLLVLSLAGSAGCGGAVTCAEPAPLFCMVGRWCENAANDQAYFETVAGDVYACDGANCANVEKVVQCEACAETLPGAAVDAVCGGDTGA